MINAVDIKKGLILKVENNLYAVSLAQFVSPGKGSAFVRTKLKHISKRNVIERTFKSAEKVEDVEIEKRNMQFIYKDNDEMVFMDNNDYEQINIPKDLVEDIIPFMKEEMPVEINFYEEKPVTVSPPNFVELKVSYTEDAIKGDTVGTSRKSAQVETGGEVQVPLYIQLNDIIKIDLRDFSFVERVRSTDS